DHVAVVADGQVVACHVRSYGRGERVLDPLHYLVTLERKPAALDHAPVYRDWQLPAAFAELRQALERQLGVRGGARHFIRVLHLAEQEVAAGSANALAARVRAAASPVAKDFDTYDFSALPGLPKQKVLELARGEWIEQHFNCCLIGNAGTGKTHLATALGLAACRQLKRVRFFTAAGLVTQLEEAAQQHRLDRFLGQLDRADLLICDALGYLSFRRAGAELLFP